MKPIQLMGILSGLLILMMACSEIHQEPIESSNNEDGLSTFNAALAAELGADNYGMRRYVMAFLKAGSNRSQDVEEASKIQAGHMAHINKMAEEGLLVLAGPFLDGGSIRGIFLFAVDTIEEARDLTEADPAVQSGRLEMELHPWYGSAALMQVNDIHKTIAIENP